MYKDRPNLIYGTAWKKDKTAEYVQNALKLGFRAIDTAGQPKHYQEHLVGEGIKLSGISRDELFIQTKFTPLAGQDINNTPYSIDAPLIEQMEQSLASSKKNLQVDKIDSLLLHSPLESLEQTLEAWEKLEEFVKRDEVRMIGISNCYSPNLLSEIYKSSTIKPSFVQNRFYDESGYDREIRKFCKQNSITYQSFWTLTANPHILNSPTLLEIAKAHERGVAEVFFRFCTQIDIIPLIGAISKEHLEADLKIYEFELDDIELQKIDLLLN